MMRSTRAPVKALAPATNCQPRSSSGCSRRRVRCRPQLTRGAVIVDDAGRSRWDQRRWRDVTGMLVALMDDAVVRIQGHHFAKRQLPILPDPTPQPFVAGEGGRGEIATQRPDQERTPRRVRTLREPGARFLCRWRAP